MNCTWKSVEKESLLLDYCTSKLNPQARLEMEQHLDACEDCRTIVELHRQLDESLEDWEAPAISENFDRRLFARIEAEQDRPLPWWRGFVSLEFSWKPLLPLAMAALALVLLLTRDRKAPEVAQQPEVIRLEDLDQVEKAMDDIEAFQALYQQEADTGGSESL